MKKRVCVGLVAALASGPLFAQADAGLAGWWKMDEAAGATTLADSSGSGRSLTLGAGCSLVPGRFGNALRLNGTTSAYAQFSSPAMSNVTVSAWVRQDGGGAVSGNSSPRILVAGGYYFRIGLTNSVQGTTLIFGENGTDWVSNASAPLRVFPGKWAHIAMTYQSAYTNATDRVVWATFYMNGVRCGTTLGFRSWAAMGDLRAGAAFLGNAAVNGTRPLDGLLDEVRLYNRVLSEKEILAFYYNRAPLADAGPGQVCFRDETVLQGRLLNNNPFQRDLSAATLWSLASAPEGAGPVILNPDVPASRVSLPAPGVYTFRLAATNRFGSASDDVTITRAAGEPQSHSAPSVTMAAASTNGVLPVEVSVAASVSDDGLPGPLRVSWSKVSGPGGVFFDNPFTNSTTASFSTNGTYVLQLTADDGSLSASGQMTVTVSPPEGNLSGGLVHWWPMDDDPGVKKAYDACGSNLLTLTTEALLQPGKSGLGMRFPHGLSTAQTAFAFTNAACMTFAMWLHHDNAYTNNPYMRLLDDWPFTLYYKLADRQLFFQCAGTNGAEYRWTQTGTVMSSNRWHHVAVLFDRRATEAAGMQQTFYIDGVRQGSTALTTAFPGAAAFTNSLYIGNNASWRNFDGVLDDVRVYDRFLTETEVRTLATDPDNNHAPVIEVAAAVSGYAGRELTLGAAVFDDGRPAGGALTYRWERVFGDPDGITIDTATEVPATVTLVKSGAYTLRLTVFDGERLSASEHISLQVLAGGALLLVK